MQNVTLKMTDEMTGQSVCRTIDIRNAMSNGDESWVLPCKEEQRANLELWINERGNEQHNTILSLNGWTFS